MMIMTCMRLNFTLFCLLLCICILKCSSMEVGYNSEELFVYEEETTYFSIDISENQFTQCFMKPCCMEFIYDRGDYDGMHHVCVDKEYVFNCSPESEFYVGTVTSHNNAVMHTLINSPGEHFVSVFATCNTPPCDGMESTRVSLRRTRLFNPSTSNENENENVCKQPPYLYVPHFIDTNGFEDAPSSSLNILDADNSFPSIKFHVPVNNQVAVVSLNISQVENDSSKIMMDYQYFYRHSCCDDDEEECIVDIETGELPDCTKKYKKEQYTANKRPDDPEIIGKYTTGAITAERGDWKVTVFMNYDTKGINFEFARPTRYEEETEEDRLARKAKYKETQFALNKIVSRLDIKLKTNTVEASETLVAFGEMDNNIGMLSMEVVLVCKWSRNFRETYLMKHFHHNNVISSHDVSVGDNFYVILQDRLIPLSDYLGSKNEFPMIDFYIMTHHILDGIKFLHDNNILHRDLKPANIGWNKRVKAWQIADFDLYHEVGETELCWSDDVGTHPYMAPEVEIVRTRGYGKPADMYSFGVIISEYLKYLLPINEHEIELVNRAKIMCHSLTQIEQTNRMTAYEAYDYLFQDEVLSSIVNMD